MSRYGVTRDELAELLDGEPRYRVDQVWKGLYERRAPLEDATDVPAALRTLLADVLPLELEPMVEQSDGDTFKWLWRGAGDAQLETVLMLKRSRATVCVSSQAGCAMGCTFCATGQAGFERHCTVGEIVEQVLRAQHSSPKPVTNVVYMGMGEPLANTDAVWASIERLHGALGLSARKITVSTVGVVPGMRQMLDWTLPVTLAVSLHAPDDELRNQLVPLNRRYPIAELLDAAADYAGTHGRRVSFEYAAIAGLNDHPSQAEALGRLLHTFPGAGGAHVNLIPLNPTSGFGGRASPRARLVDFRDRLERHHVTATIRRNRGVRIDAACGQLRTRTPASNPEEPTGQNGAVEEAS
jgi:23S rRNA (adenine2503-C2)-methyltransferase